MQLHLGRAAKCPQRPAKTPNPHFAALPTARAITFHLPISESIANQHRHVRPGRAATARAIAVESLAVLQEVAEGKQSRRVGVHGRSILSGQAQGVTSINCRLKHDLGSGASGKGNAKALDLDNPPTATPAEGSPESGGGHHDPQRRKLSASSGRPPRLQLSARQVRLHLR